MSRWFRMYADAARNPKVARLSDRDYRVWVSLLSVAAENDGAIPALEDLKHVLSTRLDHLSSAVDRLIRGGLIDALAIGYTPHSWTKFQYKSDTSNDRVTLHRKRKVTPPETDTEAETEFLTDASASGDADKQFWDTAKSYLGKSKAGMIGKWVKVHGRERAAAAIAQAQVERAVDPIPYIEKVLRRGNGTATGDWISPC